MSNLIQWNNVGREWRGNLTCISYKDNKYQVELKKSDSAGNTLGIRIWETKEGEIKSIILGNRRVRLSVEELMEISTVIEQAVHMLKNPKEVYKLKYN